MLAHATHTSVSRKNLGPLSGICRLLWRTNTSICRGVGSGSSRSLWWMGVCRRRIYDVALVNFFLPLSPFSLFSLFVFLVQFSPYSFDFMFDFLFIFFLIFFFFNLVPHQFVLFDFCINLVLVILIITYVLFKFFYIRLFDNWVSLFHSTCFWQSYLDITIGL